MSSKSRLEEWICELACVKIQQYCSDNGVFTVEEFRGECENNNQKPSFSGVGVKHQNARAEHSIPSIMYMAWTFMSQVALHWGESHVDGRYSGHLLSNMPYGYMIV